MKSIEIKVKIGDCTADPIVEEQFLMTFKGAYSKIAREVNKDLFYIKPMTEQEQIDHDIAYAKFKQENPDKFDEFGNRKEEPELEECNCCGCGDCEDCEVCKACGY